eukprot:9161442-Alexandrium_andersonii.AAC.1
MGGTPSGPARGARAPAPATGTPAPAAALSPGSRVRTGALDDGRVGAFETHTKDTRETMIT